MKQVHDTSGKVLNLTTVAELAQRVEIPSDGTEAPPRDLSFDDGMGFPGMNR